MITTIPQLNEFLAAKKTRLDAEQRDMDHAEGLMMNAQFDQLAAARKLEEETATVGVVEVVVAHVAEAPQQPIATELEWLQYFYQEADFGPADQDVRDIIKCDFMRQYGKQLPEGYNGEE